MWKFTKLPVSNAPTLSPVRVLCPQIESKSLEQLIPHIEGLMNLAGELDTKAKKQIPTVILTHECALEYKFTIERSQVEEWTLSQVDRLKGRKNISLFFNVLEKIKYPVLKVYNSGYIIQHDGHLHKPKLSLTNYESLIIEQMEGAEDLKKDWKKRHEEVELYKRHPYSRVNLQNGAQIEYRICADIHESANYDSNLVTLVSAQGLGIGFVPDLAKKRKAVVVNDKWWGIWSCSSKNGYTREWGRLETYKVNGKNADVYVVEIA